MDEYLLKEYLPLAQVLASDGAWPTLRALTTVSANLASRPLDERVRTLRTSNEAVARTLLEYPVAARFLKLLGFVEVEGFLSVVGTDVQRSARAAVEALAAVREEAERRGELRQEPGESGSGKRKGSRSRRRRRSGGVILI